MEGVYEKQPGCVEKLNGKYCKLWFNTLCPLKMLGEALMGLAVTHSLLVLQTVLLSTENLRKRNEGKQQKLKCRFASCLHFFDASMNSSLFPDNWPQFILPHSRHPPSIGCKFSSPSHWSRIYLSTLSVFLPIVSISLHYIACLRRLDLMSIIHQKLTFQ